MVYMSSTDRSPPPTVSGMKHWSAARSITVNHRSSAMRAGGDVEEDHFVRALFIVAKSQLDRVAHIAQLARLGFAELNTACDLARMHVQARNDALGDHGRISS